MTVIGSSNKNLIFSHRVQVIDTGAAIRGFLTVGGYVICSFLFFHEVRC